MGFPVLTVNGGSALLFSASLLFGALLLSSCALEKVSQQPGDYNDVVSEGGDREGATPAVGQAGMSSNAAPSPVGAPGEGGLQIQPQIPAPGIALPALQPVIPGQVTAGAGAAPGVIPQPVSNGGAGAAAMGGEVPAAEPKFPEPPYEWEYVFDQNQLRTYNITMPEEQWHTLRRNARDKEYVPAELTVDDEVVGTIGVRFKGGHTLRSCFENGDEPTCVKMSLKLKFNDVEPDKRWHGLKRLHLNAMKADRTYVRERLGYKLWADMGVVAPHAMHARVNINGVYNGLFVAVESVDGRFTDNYYSMNGDGDLYKEAWPQLPFADYYANWIKTNSETATHAGIIAFAEALSAATDAELPAVIAQYMDIAALQRYMAIDMAMSHWDGVTGFYCTPERDPRLPHQCSNHNFYFYQHEEAVRFELIPWDLDNTFTPDDEFLKSGVPRWRDGPDACTVGHSVYNLPIQAPGCDPLLRGLALAEPSGYKAALQQLLDGPFVVSKLMASVDAWRAQIQGAVGEEPADAGPGFDGWRASFDGGDFRKPLPQQLDELRWRIESELASFNPPPPMQAQGGNPGLPAGANQPPPPAAPEAASTVVVPSEWCQPPCAAAQVCVEVSTQPGIHGCAQDPTASPPSASP